MEKGVMFKAWRGWLLVQHDFNNKRNILTRAVNKMKRRRLYKAFSKWAELHNKAHRPSHFDKAARAVVLGGCRRRTFGAWREHTKDVRRQFKMAAHTARMREEFLERLVEAGLRQVMHKRIRRAWDAFDKFSEVRRAKRNKARQVIGRAMNREQARAFGRWSEYVAQLNKQRGQLKRAVARMSKATMARAFDAWQGQQLHKKRCLMKIIKGTQARAFAKWQDNLRLLRKAKIVFARWDQRTRYAAFNGWWLNVEEKRRQTEMCSKICKRILNRAVRNAWAQWMYCVEQSCGCTLEQVKALRDQNARLRRDNERFVRLVDSGEWGRGRVEELSEAGRLLRDERKQLEDLIRSIKDEKDGFVKDAELQAREARALKDRLVSGNFVQRNKLNVRGGSAFNSMQRGFEAGPHRQRRRGQAASHARRCCAQRRPPRDGQGFRFCRRRDPDAGCQEGAAAVCQGRREEASAAAAEGRPAARPDAADDGAATGERAKGRRGGERVGGGAVESHRRRGGCAGGHSEAGQDRRRFGLINYGEDIHGMGIKRNEGANSTQQTVTYIVIHTQRKGAWILCYSERGPRPSILSNRAESALPSPLSAPIGA